MSEYLLAFDGSCGPSNPGPFAAYGFTIHKDGVLLVEESVQLERGPNYSNNYAEFYGLYAGLEKLYEIAEFSDRILVRGDSTLVIKTMAGKFGGKAGTIYYPAYTRALGMLRLLQQKFIPVQFEWVGREKNQAADKLSKYKR